jgi:hypothetical protein
MKYTFYSLIFLISYAAFSQPNTEVYLFDLESVYGGLDIFNMRNISNDKGYDSQPYFKDNNTILFAANNLDQTDIASFSISENKKTWYNLPTEGGEYSPISYPNSNGKVTAVRLDPNGMQRLYIYESGSKESVEIMEGLQVAYYAFYNKNTLVSSVLGVDDLDLVISNIQTKSSDTLLSNTGRSIHLVPDSKSISYTLVNKEKNHDLYLLDMESLDSFFVCQLPIGIQDYVWLNNSQILIGSGTKIFMYDTFLNADWQEVADLSGSPFKEITRMAVSPDEKKLALVAEPLH